MVNIMININIMIAVSINIVIITINNVVLKLHWSLSPTMFSISCGQTIHSNIGPDLYHHIRLDHTVTYNDDHNIYHKIDHNIHHDIDPRVDYDIDHNSYSAPRLLEIE